MENRELESINKVVECISSFFIATGLTNNYNEFCGHDVDLTGKTSTVDYTAALEVKERNFTSTKLKKYSIEGMMIEKIKYDHLMNQKNPMYANYIKQNRFQLILVWNMKKLTQLRQKNIECSKTTEFTNQEKVVKDSYLLSIEDCSLIYVKHNDCTHEMPWHKINQRQLKKLIEKYVL